MLKEFMFKISVSLVNWVLVIAELFLTLAPFAYRAFSALTHRARNDAIPIYVVAGAFSFLFHRFIFQATKRPLQLSNGWNI